MGSVLAGIFGGGQATQQTVTPDATTQQLNALRLQQLQSLFGNMPYGSFGMARPDIYSPSPQVGDLYNQSSLYDLSPFYNRAVNTLQQPVDTSNLMSFNDYLGYGTNAINQAFGGPDIDYNKIGQDYLKNISTPQIMNQAALAGLEGGGAVSESLGRAGSELALPLTQLQQGSNIARGQAVTGFVNNLPNANSLFSLLPYQMQAAQGQAAGAYASASQPFTNAMGTLAQRASTLFPLADYSRQLSEQDLLRMQGVYSTALTGIPYSPGSSTSGKQSQQPLFNFFGQG